MQTKDLKTIKEKTKVNAKQRRNNNDIILPLQLMVRKQCDFPFEERKKCFLFFFFFLVSSLSRVEISVHLKQFDY